MATKDGEELPSLEDVKKESTYMGLLKMCRQLDISPPEGNADIVREVIINHLQTQEQELSTTGIWDSLLIDSSADLDNRNNLLEFFTKAHAFIRRLPTFFKDDLNELFPGYSSYLLSATEELKSTKRILLVAGELASGKSSLINLLLGDNILPTSNLRCTAAIVEVSHGDMPRAVMHFKKDISCSERPPIEIKYDENKDKGSQASRVFKADLETHITLRDPYTDESPYEKIEIFWPSKMLKGGLTIVDSPGVGDSTALLHQLAEYMTHALGCIYVIDSTSIINKHRLGQLLLKAMEASGDYFDSNTALFVCNRWDMVSADDAEKVKTSLNDALSMLIPGIRKSRLYTISTKQSLVKLDYGHAAEEHQQLIQGIQLFLPKAVRGKLRIYYRYLSALLKRCIYSLRMCYVSTTKTLGDMHDEVERRAERQSTLQTGGEKLLEEMRKEVKRLTVEAADKLFNHLQSPEIRQRLTTWLDKDCPQTKWRKSVKLAMSSVTERIANEINRWENASHFDRKIGNYFVEKFEENYDLLSTEVKEVQTIFLPAEEQKMVLDLHNSMRAKKRQGQNTTKSVKSTEGDNIHSIGAAVASAVDLDSKEIDVKKLFKEHFEQDPCEVMTAITAMGLQSLTNVNLIAALNKYFERYEKGVDEVGKRVPNMLKADQILLQQMIKEMDTQEVGLKYYPSFSKKCLDIQGNLDMFYIRNLMETDFMADQLSYCKERDILGIGSFATVYKATLKDGDKTKVVALKEPKGYISTLDVTEVLLEESILREVDHENIVSYYGLCRAKGSRHNIKLNMVMEFCPYTLKKNFVVNYKGAPALHGKHSPKQLESRARLTDVLLQIIKGLSYLHAKGIVHRDLKPDNILLTETNVAKIADLGLAKKVKEAATQKIGTPVYIAPEILLFDGKYDTKADIYSFAMITWELWYGIDLAEYAATELPSDLEESIKKRWRPSLDITNAPDEFWTSLIKVCWDQSPKNRPRPQDIETQLLKVQQHIKKSRQT